MISLPPDPKESDYEDLVSAALVACGYFIETRLTLKKGKEEILEFDAVATPTNEDYKTPILVEVKSGGFGLPDLFKLVGQMTFTGIDRGWLVHLQPTDERKASALCEVASPTGVELKQVTLDGLGDGDPFPPVNDLSDGERTAVFSAVWWGRLADRVAQAKFKSWCRSHGLPLPPAVEAAKCYEQGISQSFFKKNPVRRAAALYQAYQACPKLQKTLIDFASDGDPDRATKVRNSSWSGHEHLWLQYVMTLENRARLWLIKNAFDQKFREPAGVEHIGRIKIDWGRILALLPEKFQRGMEKLEALPSPQRVPFFLQVFTEVFGGFYFPDKSGEVELLSKITGIAAPDIPAALNLMDDFFAFPNGWTPSEGGMVMLKMVPAYMRGAGCFFRKDAFGVKHYSRYAPDRAWQLGQWHNALYKVLEPSRKVTEADESA